MKLRQQGSITYPITFLMVDSADHITGKAGIVPTVTISKNGAAFGSPLGAVSEIGNGWYSLASNATDRNTLGDFLLHAAASGADPVDDRYTIVPWDPFDGATLGLTKLVALDMSAVSLVTAYNAGVVTITSTTSLAGTITGLTIPADWLRMYWTVKRSLLDADADAIIQIVVTNGEDEEDGLVVIAGEEAEDETEGSLVVNQPAGTVAFALTAGATALLPEAGDLVWDLKYHLDDVDEEKKQCAVGTASITLAVTRT